jgi:hypothetical protein
LPRTRFRGFDRKRRSKNRRRDFSPNRDGGFFTRGFDTLALNAWAKPVARSLRMPHSGIFSTFAPYRRDCDDGFPIAEIDDAYGLRNHEIVCDL